MLLVMPPKKGMLLSEEGILIGASNPGVNRRKCLHLHNCVWLLCGRIKDFKLDT